MGTIVYCHNPLRVSERTIEHKQGSLWELAPKTDLPFVCSVNGEYKLRDEWVYRVQPHDLVVYSTLLQGGGGGGKNPLRLIATIALSVAAPGLGDTFAAAAGFSGAFAEAAFSAGVLIGGQALINAVLPPPRLPTSQQGASINAPSPTYSLGAQANSARLGAAVPVIYGRHQIYPDLGDQTLVYNPTLKQQNLIQLFVIGQGQYTLSDYKIEDTPISSFKDVDIYTQAPGDESADLRTGIYNVAEVSGQELIGPISGDLQWIGPFTVNPPNKPITQVHVEMAFPRGLYLANDVGGLENRTVTWSVQLRQIDDFGGAVGSWVEVGTETLTANDNAALRVSEFYAGLNGRYEVRAARTNAKDLSLNVGNDILFSGVAGISNANATAGAATTTRIQVELQASDNLNTNTARRLNLIAQRKIQTWRPDTGWSAETESRSIVWAFADICRRAGVPDSRINLQELYELDQYYTVRAMTFDAVFDNRISLFEALTLVARAGRAVPIIQGGQITMIRDSQKTLPVAMFNMRNIRAGSFGISYTPRTEETSTAVEVNYIDGLTFKPKQMTVTQPGTDGLVVSKVDLFGVTDEQIAENEARYLVATNQYRRRTVKFSTEMEGFIVNFGDLILVSHDMPSWGVSGDVIEFDPTTLTATMSDPVEFSGGTNLIRLQFKNGSVSDPFPVVAGQDEYSVVFESMPDPMPYTGCDYEQTRFVFANSVSISQRVKVRSIQPSGIDTVDVFGVIDDDEVYNFSNDSSKVVLNQPVAKYAPDNLSINYDTANEAEKESYGFFSKPNGLMTNSDSGYKYT